MEGFPKLEANNDNEQLHLGDWVTITNELDARLVETYLGSKPPYVIAHIGPKVVSVISREQRPTVTGKEPIHEFRVSEQTGLETPSYGVSAAHLKRFDRLEIVPE
jgi:hypothetical protein